MWIPWVVGWEYQGRTNTRVFDTEAEAKTLLSTLKARGIKAHAWEM